MTFEWRVIEQETSVLACRTWILVKFSIVNNIKLI